MDEELANRNIINGLGVLAENQNRINQKIDSILEFVGTQYAQTNDMKQLINQQSVLINYLTSQLSSAISKLADMEIQYQNSNSDVTGISNSIQDLSNQIEGIRQTLNEMKLYSEI